LRAPLWPRDGGGAASLGRRQPIASARVGPNGGNCRGEHFERRRTPTRYFGFQRYVERQKHLQKLTLLGTSKPAKL
jgi:hypothetical protein